MFCIICSSHYCFSIFFSLKIVQKTTKIIKYIQLFHYFSLWWQRFNCATRNGHDYLCGWNPRQEKNFAKYLVKLIIYVIFAASISTSRKQRRVITSKRRWKWIWNVGFNSPVTHWPEGFSARSAIFCCYWGSTFFGSRDRALSPLSPAIFTRIKETNT